MCQRTTRDVSTLAIVEPLAVTPLSKPTQQVDIRGGIASRVQVPARMTCSSDSFVGLGHALLGLYRSRSAMRR